MNLKNIMLINVFSKNGSPSVLKHFYLFFVSFFQNIHDKLVTYFITCFHTFVNLKKKRISLFMAIIKAILISLYKDSKTCYISYAFKNFKILVVSKHNIIDLCWIVEVLNLINISCMEYLAFQFVKLIVFFPFWKT